MSSPQVNPAVPLNTLAEPSGQGVVVHRDGKPLFVSDGYARVHEFDSREAVLALDSLETLYAGQDRGRLQVLEAARRREGELPPVFEYDGRSQGGRVIPVLCNPAIIEWDGEPAIQQTITDLTGTRTSRCALQAGLQELDRKVRLRNEELSHLRDRMLADTAARVRQETAFGGHEGDWSLVVGSAEDFTARKEAQEKQLAYANLLDNIRLLQSDYIAEVPASSVFEQLLSRLLSLTDSNYGFIGEVVYSDDGTPYLKPQALTNMTSVSDGDMSGRLGANNQDALFARAMSTGEPVFSNPNPRPLDESTAQSPWFSCFLAVPLFRGDELVGVAGLANRPGGYDQSLLEFLDPLLATAAHIIDGYRNANRRQRAEAEKIQLAAQLRQSQKMEAVGHLTGGIAHDFNNILASVLGFAGLAHDRSARTSDEKLTRYMREVLRAGERARDLVGQMLTFSRSGSGDPRPLDLSHDLEATVRMLRATFPTTVGLQLQIADSDIPNVICDPVHLYQAVMNVCINARDAIQEKGSIVVSLTRTDVGEKHCDACREQFSGDFVEITVSDTGAGISEQVRQRVFDPFYTTKDVGKGTGMGLSVVHGIIHQYHGHIVLESNPGAGTLVRMFMPATAEASYNIEQIRPDLTKTDIPVERGYILIVDDEPSVASFLGELLGLRGYSVQTLTSGREAWTLLSKHPSSIDLLITDQTMPDMTGKELVENVRSLNQTLPVIICTGYSEQINQQIVDAWGYSNYLEKPIQIDQLLRSIKQLMPRSDKDGLGIIKPSADI